MKTKRGSTIAALVAACLFLVAGCNKQPAAVSAPSVRGIVEDVLTDKHSLLVKHEDIVGVMPAMTMQFRVDDAALAKAKKGQTLTATFVDRGGVAWLDNVSFAEAPPTAAKP